MKESVDHRRVRFGFRWFCPWWKMLQGPTLRILLQLRCPEIIDVTGRVAARIPCANSRHFDEFACFLSILSRYVVSALAKEPCTYHIPFLHLFFSAAIWTRVVFKAFGFRNCGDSVSQVETRTVSWGFSSWNSSGWKFGHWNWGYGSNVWYFHFSWLLAVSSSPEAMFKRYLNRTKTQVTPDFFHDARTSRTVMIWWDSSKNLETNPVST